MIASLVAAPAYGGGRARVLVPDGGGPGGRKLQERVAGWYPGSKRQIHFALDGVYGLQTVAAVRAFQRHHGIRTTGVAGPATRRVLRRLHDGDGSTAHFDWSEFHQNRNSSCSARANAYAGTFGGGMVSARRAKRNVRRLMWRLEAVRAKGRNRSIGINSGFRSVAYNDCIGGARASQHMYGTAADNRMTDTRNRYERRLARRSEFHGIGCYARLSHNHLDIRMDNPDLAAARSWWWPDKDAKGRDLDADGKVCWGQRARRRSGAARTTTAAGLARVSAAQPGSGSLAPSPAEVRAFARAGEVGDLGGTD